MLGRVFLFFTLIPLIEIALLVWIAQLTSPWFVLIAVLGVGVLGGWLARRQGLRTVRRISEDMEQGRLPAESLFDGLCILIAAVLLIIPGFLTDLAALVLLFPPTRRRLAAFVRRQAQASIVVVQAGGFARHEHDEIIDVKVLDHRPGQPGA